VSAAAQFVFHGAEEFRAMLREMGAAFADDAYTLAVTEIETAEANVKAAYAVADGDLVEGVTVIKKKTRTGVSVTLKNKAHHAWLYDNGSVTRQNRRGANRGRMPAKHVFDREMVLARKRFVENIKAMMVRRGLKVTGDV